MGTDVSHTKCNIVLSTSYTLEQHTVVNVTCRNFHELIFLARIDPPTSLESMFCVMSASLLCRRVRHVPFRFIECIQSL
jgi:hypothetical protein